MDTDLQLRYQNLSRCIALLLSANSPLEMDIKEIRDTFLQGLTNALQCSLDINITKEQYASISGEWTEDKDAVDEFLVKTIENPQSYVIITFYYSNFIQILLKNSPSSVREKVWNILLENNVGLSDFDEAEQEYEKMMEHLKKKVGIN